MLLPINLLTHFLLEKEPWLASCITFIPTPAIPIPTTTMHKACSHPDIGTVKIKTAGTINKANITIAFIYNSQFPVRLISFSLK